MRKRAFEQAAAMVHAMLDGKLTHEPPAWADARFDVLADELSADYTRAVQTAEAFILHFSAANPRFDAQWFLVACGLVEPPAKKGKR